jgi:hypothetical protein
MINENNCQNRREEITALVLGELEPEAADELKRHIESCKTCKSLYQKLTDEEETIRSAFRKIADKGEVLKSSLIEQLDKKEPAKTIGIHWGNVIKSPFTKVAAAAVVVIALLLLFNNSQATLYAQVIKAMKEARTIHVVGEWKSNGQWRKNVEIWYQNGVGEKRIAWRGDKQTIRIDNGKYIWEYTSGNDFASRNKSTGLTQLPGEILDIQRYLKECERDPAGDKVIDGFKCELYTATRLRDSEGNRILFWVDEQMRLRKFEEHVLRDGRWEDDEYGEVKYDVAFESNIFVPDFGPNVKIVEADEMLDLYSDPNEALFTREELGLIFSVHKLVKCREGLIFAVTSVRPTDIWRRKVRSSDFAAWNYGHFSLGSSWKRLDKYGRGLSYQPIELGEIYHGGLQVKWTLFFPQGFEPEGPKECELEVYLGTIGSLYEKRTKEGLPTNQRFKPIAVLPLPEEQTTLEQVLDDTFKSLSDLEPYAARDSLTLQSVPFTEQEMEEYINTLPDDSDDARRYRSDKSIRLHHGRTSKPSRISKEDWVKDRMDYLKEIENNYKEFLQEVEKRDQRDR